MGHHDGDEAGHAGHHHDHGGSRPGHAGHRHGVSAGADGRWLGAALALIVAFMAGEVVVGIVVNSLALLSDAAHMLTDAASLALAMVALRLAARPPKGGFTYGLRRAEILSAQANGITLLVLAAWLGYEAVSRLLRPEDVSGLPVLATALAGIAVNLFAAGLIRRADRQGFDPGAAGRPSGSNPRRRRSLAVEGAYQHIVTDLAAFVATAVAGLVIMVTGFRQADPIASLVVVALMLRAGISLVRESGRVLLEAAPVGLDPGRIGHDMVHHDGVVEVHDLHVWEITSGAPALSAHVIVAPSLDCHRLRLALESMLQERYDLTHTTLQVDHAPPTLHRIAGTDGA